jgi:hypothetical protein
MRSGGRGRGRLLEAQGKGRKGKERIDHSFSLFLWGFVCLFACLSVRAFVEDCNPRPSPASS